MEDELYLREAESYIKSNDIQKLLKECIVNLCVIKPENPILYIRDYFDRLYKVISLSLICFVSITNFQG